MTAPAAAPETQSRLDPTRLASDIRPAVGQRNRDTVAKYSAPPKVPVRGAGWWRPEPERWHFAVGSAPTPKPGPIKRTVSKVNAGEKFVKDRVKDEMKKMRLIATPATAEITPVPEDASFFITGGMKFTPGKRSAYQTLDDYWLWRKGKSTATTSGQLLLSSYYVMLGWAHELIYFYLYKGWYEFAFKTILMKEIVGGAAMLPYRLLTGPDRETQQEKNAKREMKLRRPSIPLLHQAALNARAEMRRPLTEAERIPFERTMERIRAKYEPSDVREPGAPVHADVPVMVETAEERERRRREFAGSPDAPARPSPAVETPRPRPTVVPPRSPRPVSPVDPHWKRNRRGGRGL